MAGRHHEEMDMERRIKTTELTANKAGIEKTSEIEWYCFEDGERKGPFLEMQIADSLGNGSSTSETLVWRSGFADWKRIRDTELRTYLQNDIPPVPLSVISDKWMWCLATVPLVLGAIEDETWGLVVGLILNTVFLILDIGLLKKSGRQAGAWLWLGLLIVPIYMGVRAYHTNKNWIPLIVWVVLFVLAD